VLGHLKLSELRPATLNAAFVAMTKDGARKDGKPGGYSRATIKKTQDVLSSVLRTAVEWEILEKNPMDKVRSVGECAADKIEFFTPDQAATFLDYIEKPYKVKTKGHKRTDDTGKDYTVGDYERTKEIPEQIRVLFNLAIYGGLRKGELLALEWSDIDFDNDTVTVSKAVSVVAGQQITKEPKTKTSRRTVSIPHFLTQRIRVLRTERLKYRLSLGDYWQGNDWIFVQDNGKQMSYFTPYSAFQDTIARYNSGRPATAQLPAIPFHGLRHTSATLLIASKQDVRTVSSRLGHAQASTTMNIYAHALQETDRKAVNALENMLVKHA
jgi:integrase